MTQTQTSESYGKMEQIEAKGEIIALTEKIKEPLVKLYSSVFGGAPWFEQYRCKNCGQQYGAENATEKSLKEEYAQCINPKCPSPSEPLTLVPFYEGTFYNVEEQKEVSGLGESIFLDALQREGFIGVASKLEDKLIGFSWGYKLPKDRSPSVWFDNIQELFKQKGLNTENIFYAAEVGVTPEYQQNGVGTEVSRKRLAEAKNRGFEAVTFRTKNGKLVKVYEKLFGENAGTKLFADPDPSKDADVRWYLWDFKNFKA